MKRVDPLVARIGESLSLIGDYGKTTDRIVKIITYLESWLNFKWEKLLVDTFTKVFD